MTINNMKWSLSEFLMHMDLRGQTWCTVEIGNAAGFSIPPSDQIYFYAALQGEVRIAGGAAEPICLKEGEAAIILSGDAHAVRTRTNCHVENINFLHDGSYCDIPPVFHTGEGSPVARVLCGRLKIRWPGGLLPAAIPAALVLEAEKTLISARDLDHATIGTGAAALLTKIASLILTVGLRQHAQRMEIFPLFAMNDPIDRALQLIDMHAEVPWTVAGLAQKVGMGRSNFAARFLEVTGRTPIEALADRRMQCAADLLQHGPLKISEIAMRVGYSSEAAFIRRFVDKFGVTPGRMRVSLQSREPALHA